jgi:histidine triad (HIT) family protein
MFLRGVEEIPVASDCVFCNIISRELPAHVVAEDDYVIVFKDINPKAATHLLIVPKKHIVDIREIGPEDAAMLSNLLFMAKKLSGLLPSPGAFRLLFNNGPEVGQRVFHMHAHFLAGQGLSEF